MTNEEYLDTPLSYGTLEVSHFIPKDATTKFLEISEEKPPIENIEEELIERINHPKNAPSLKEWIAKNYQKGEPVVILVDDNTRPNLHTRILLPYLVPKVLEYGVTEEDLKIVIASGTHRPPTDQEIENQILGTAIWNKYKEHVVTHNCDEGVEQIGTSSRNTPIFLNKLALKAALIIGLSDSEYHYFAGVAGTVKQLFPGISGRETIARNHPKMFDKELGFKPACRLGNTEANPVIQDMIEMAKEVKQRIPIFCIDAIIHNNQIVELHAGDIITLHQLARETLKPLRVLEVQEEADLVIITTGALGLNLYQAGKAIHAAWNAAKKGGKILLLARAQDGVGNEAYHKTMQAVKDMGLDEALVWVIENKCNEETFRIGNQKPVDLLRILKDSQIDMITEMDPTELKETFRINPVKIEGSIQETLRAYVQKFLEEKPGGLIYVMNDAGLAVQIKGN
ncbi:MAG: DUF2088 domain-containing protein [Candidatus Heimdallarchaeota archaeon]|nr:DUF2088 domain-containing protein [Candidatus Heimdallarchaeota archaeon]